MLLLRIASASIWHWDCVCAFFLLSTNLSLASIYLSEQKIASSNVALYFFFFLPILLSFAVRCFLVNFPHFQLKTKWTKANTKCQRFDSMKLFRWFYFIFKIRFRTTSNLLFIIVDVDMRNRRESLSNVCMLISAY